MQKTQEMWVQSPGQKDLLKKEMAAHSSILAWKIRWMSGWVTVREGRKDSDSTEHALKHTNRLQRSTGIRLLPVYVEVRNERKERITEQWGYLKETE